jgi:pyruvate dehydrogenase E1 component beta subunit
MAVGAALTGMRPVVEIMFGDFITLAMDQIVNQAAHIRYMTGGQVKVPLTIRTTLGAGRSAAGQHSQSLHAWFCHIPGLKVVLPSTPYDAKGLLKAAIRDDNPVLFFEDKMMYDLKGPVPEEEYLLPLGQAEVKRAGEDVTIVATSSMVQEALSAADQLGEDGISAEVVDPRTLLPLDKETLVNSAMKTGRAIVVDEGYRAYGVTAELAAVILEGAFFHLRTPVVRIGAMDVPVPFSKPLELATIPKAEDIVAAARRLMEEEM